MAIPSMSQKVIKLYELIIKNGINWFLLNHVT
jgi:hypothetical protein